MSAAAKARRRSSTEEYRQLDLFGEEPVEVIPAKIEPPAYRPPAWVCVVCGAKAVAPRYERDQFAGWRCDAHWATQLGSGPDWRGWTVDTLADQGVPEAVRETLRRNEVLTVGMVADWMADPEASSLGMAPWERARLADAVEALRSGRHLERGSPAAPPADEDLAEEPAPPAADDCWRCDCGARSSTCEIAGVVGGRVEMTGRTLCWPCADAARRLRQEADRHDGSD